MSAPALERLLATETSPGGGERRQTLFLDGVATRLARARLVRAVAQAGLRRGGGRFLGDDLRGDAAIVRAHTRNAGVRPQQTHQ